MKIDSTINILGGMPDLDLILDYLPAIDPAKAVPSSSTIRTKRAVGRFETAIKTTYFNPSNTKLSSFLMSTLRSESITDYSKYILFLTASANNELLDYLNRLVFFPALYSGRAIIKSEEVLACLVELKQTESQLQKWSDYTLKLSSSKYLTLLKKFNLVEGSVSKTILHPFLSDKAFVFFIYWFMSLENNSNLLNSEWFVYSFHEKDLFIDRIRQNRFSKYFSIYFSGDKLKVEPLIAYKDIYYVLSQSESGN